ncbi:hypothetical protein [Alteromonas sp. BMJM2]|uniref:hypothetical protein n=1 Tax=Alteromonas sp. BMJM2 TaxID=2954241 RepID=UPI0022B2F79E|nr:hypothetical protein [Alteromonas sp. BMJM2]
MFSSASSKDTLLLSPRFIARAFIACKQQQRGVFIISSVLVLLGIAAFALTSVTVAVSDFRTVRETMLATQDHYLDVKKEMRNISSQLRTTLPSNVTTSNSSVAHSIIPSDFHGANFQAVKAFDITLHHTQSNTSVKQRFVRYPSFINVPTTLQASAPDINLTQWLFNRSSSALLPKYFPLSVVANSCTDLEEATMHWINGDCELNNNDVDHSSSVNPMLLVIKNGHLTVLNGTSFYGVVILLSDDGNVYSATVKQGASIKGALTSSNTITLQNDGAVDYSSQVLHTLQQAPRLAKVIAVPGSWFAEFE